MGRGWDVSHSVHKAEFLPTEPVSALGARARGISQACGEMVVRTQRGGFLHGECARVRAGVPVKQYM